MSEAIETFTITPKVYPHQKPEPKAAHTPGPWTMTANGEIRSHSCVSGAYVRVIGTVNDLGSDVGQANARLIAAAPDLLELAQIIDNLLGTPKMALIRAIKEKARAIIAKATGAV